MAQAVSRRPLTVESRVRARIYPCGICGGYCGSGTSFLPSSSVCPVNIIPVSLSKFISSGERICPLVLAVQRRSPPHEINQNASNVLTTVICLQPVKGVIRNGSRTMKQPRDLAIAAGSRIVYWSPNTGSCTSLP
jgi:hypothetical protein